ncbi:hypothetical protein Kpol_1055p72 [Vanderwaltozyma polyspora DSM 70294]|uniref:Endoplasmic reticulum transmembrane protein n=1 Tax=Vanderwaltozyma polyspora (strain ATCC 22028 / DSM 70294 / BCRC 21397 / CBS 2163 / NBRC 10782 / NRRL Y-8283 / UCD 57-17) TaxID=436907 RepID=A7TGE5_VANPO|nr:uncharacterized protein Kpol_1055p72 [Vanderwaltozyma polyspora DSM 70294]EDO18715.1 hypothetical protein Kpol_1055p72 [Vanderwaltozyma polyspora DSM 70294]
MSLYNQLVFIILIVEIVSFTILSLPLPSKYRKPLTLLLIKPFQNEKIQTAIKCIIAFILILFIDSINKVYRIDNELKFNKLKGTNGGGLVNSSDRVEIYSRKFLAQRNMYLTGITLFLTFTVVRTFNLVTELLKLKESYRSEKKTDSNKISTEIEETDDEINRLKEKALLLQKEME